MNYDNDNNKQQYIYNFVSRKAIFDLDQFIIFLNLELPLTKFTSKVKASLEFEKFYV
jgi:hypothetical protein